MTAERIETPQATRPRKINMPDEKIEEKKDASSMASAATTENVRAPAPKQPLVIFCAFPCTFYITYCIVVVVLSLLLFLF